jgi:tripartite-type tricarboxylate transporter receptor subunit TctC
MKRRQFLAAGAASTAPALLVMGPAGAQSPAAWPTRTVRIVHGFPPGGPVDSLARLLAAQFADRFGQQAIVEGKPGAGGTLGANFVAKAEPDGHVLFLMASGHSAAPGLYKSLPFDPVGDFTMVSMVARSPFIVLAGPSAKAQTIQQLMQQAKAEPGKIDFGTGGIGTGMHLAAVLLQSRAGIQLSHVPYKGGSAPVLALIGGEIPILFTSLAGVTAHIESGKVRPLAVTSRQRYAGLPNVPTVAETVVPEFDVSAWYALAGPKNLPPAVVTALNEMVRATLGRRDIQDTLRQQAADPWPSTPAEAQAFLAADVSRWTQVIRAENIQLPN